MVLRSAKRFRRRDCYYNLRLLPEPGTIRETKTKLSQHKTLKSCSKVGISSRQYLQIGPEQQGCLFACALCEARREGENIKEFVNIEP